MKKLICAIMFVGSAVALVTFFSVDSCLDAGGSSSKFGLVCTGVGSDFIPLYQRVAPLFWLSVFIFSSTVVFCVDKAMPNAKLCVKD
ncbi:MAG: hypothetical protein CML20_20105 [Rheinheimera sp.]|uniref:hypothetical protein n=1 Tax=Arsukibacterium sp. UBA3155 TaxID=1946058 RepID=UPI000C89E961|nr:hypothetical protein [Arsukibacterium sp. UBA3155]MAD77055.1 hypothetical protein [Rheinheimera sp.]|tara:strand:+ start:2356 stop:2616 length:261 start_codon:yes stop_codon:yes gene_type:complete